VLLLISYCSPSREQVAADEALARQLSEGRSGGHPVPPQQQQPPEQYSHVGSGSSSSTDRGIKTILPDPFLRVCEERLRLLAGVFVHRSPTASRVETVIPSTCRRAARPYVAGTHYLYPHLFIARPCTHGFLYEWRLARLLQNELFRRELEAELGHGWMDRSAPATTARTPTAGTGGARCSPCVRLYSWPSFLVHRCGVDRGRVLKTEVHIDY
jgi:hypothetical protein